MRTKSIKKPRVNVITMGCAKNLYDSEVLMAQLKANNFNVAHESQSLSDIVIVNTCGFIESAKQESIDTILQMSEAKEKGLINKLYVSGCLSERYGDQLEVEMPEVDAFFGTKDLPGLLKALNADYKKELLGERLLTTPSHYAYLKISEGCDRPCSFCAIPLMRGKHRSTAIEELVKQTQSLAKKGCKELILIAQDSTYYGLDIYGKRNLAELLKALCGVEGIEWIRLHYAFPAGFPMDVLEVMAAEPKICPYLDMPLQHGSDHVLKTMRRGITRAKTKALIDAIREKIPHITLRTTLITGYPTETEKEFEILKEWVMEMQFDRLGVFPYSHEEDTHAYVSYKDTVPEEEKIRRAEEIMDIQYGISYEKNQALIGKTVMVILDRIENGFWLGRSQKDSPEVDNSIAIKGALDKHRTGDLVKVKIKKADAFDLYADWI